MLGYTTQHPDWEWADRDGTRVLWGAAGALHAADVGPDGRGPVRVLRNFCADTFEPVAAPY